MVEYTELSIPTTNIPILQIRHRNYYSSLLFTLILLTLAVLLILLYYWENTKIVDPYDHSNQLRKLKAKNAVTAGMRSLFLYAWR